MFRVLSDDGLEIPLATTSDGNGSNEVHDWLPHKEGALEDRPNACFRHTLLNHFKQSIRLIRIRPAPIENTTAYDAYRPSKSLRSFQRDIHCDIRHTELPSDATSLGYSCLSYVWGTDAPTRRIRLNGSPYWIRRNLWDFLVFARERHCSTWFWIDALCIDQENVTERNHQVQQMGQIFPQAEKVFAWFGNNQDISNFLANSGHTRGSYAGYYAFYGSSYWNRAWIIQEFALARQVILTAGSQELPLESLHRLDWTRRNRNLSGQANNSTFHPSAIQELRGSNLIRLLHTYKLKECHDIRDRVFSLLALCGEGSGLEVNYNLSRHELVDRVLRVCPRSLCLCTIRTVANALLDEHHAVSMTDDLDTSALQFLALTNPQYGISDNLPPRNFLAQLYVPALENLSRAQSVASILLREICSCYRFDREMPRLKILPFLTGFSVYYCTRTQKNVTTYYEGSDCLVEPASDRGGYVVSMSNEMLRDIACRGLYDGVCDRAVFPPNEDNDERNDACLKLYRSPVVPAA